MNENTIPGDTIPGVLRTAATRFGDDAAYVEGERRVTFAELYDEVRAVARGYVAHGLGVGDRVVLWAPNSIDWVVAALAVTYAGGVLVPANSRYTGSEVADLVERTAAPIVVLEDGFLGRSQSRELETARDLDCLQEIV
ncbi:AMP-binding protein, partial [Nocardioides sp.]|uniref:AMP-binding protein n=1 Tax=Nocardioides sp. TaxID=35761 RepID=UPI002B26B89D